MIESSLNINDSYWLIGRKPSLERQTTLYDEHESNSAEATYPQGYGEYQSYQMGNNDQSDQQQYNYSSAVGYDGYSNYQQYDGGGTTDYDYNYDYNYGYSEGQQQAFNEDGTVIDDGKESHGYGYYDDTGYYYDGQWYSYDASYDPNYDANYSTEDAASNWSQPQTYDEQQNYDYSIDYPPQPEPDYPMISDLPKANQQQKSQQRSAPAAPSEKTIQEDSVPNKSQQQLPDVYSKRKAMLHHGDLSSSGGSVDSEQPMLRRGESNASVTTPIGPDGGPLGMDFLGMSNESPVMMMGELDRLQTDMLSHHRRVSTSSGIEEAAMNDYRSGSGPIIEPLDHRRGSIQSRLSQMSQQSRRERAEHFRRRRSSSICSDRDRDREIGSPYTSYEDERTPVNEINLSLDMNDMTPIATQVPFPSQHQHQQQYKSVSFDEDDPHMYDRMDEPGRQSTDQMDQLHPPTTPPQDPVISAPPAPVQRPCQNLTPRQKWLWAFNKICAQLMVSPQLRNSLFLRMRIVGLIISSVEAVLQPLFTARFLLGASWEKSVQDQSARWATVVVQKVVMAIKAKLLIQEASNAFKFGKLSSVSCVPEPSQ